MAEPPIYELYALRYASLATSRAHTFLGGAPDDAPLCMAYYVWLARSAEHCVLIDTGFSAETARRRGRDWERCPIDALGELGVDAAAIEHLILTHLHYDHAGNLPRLPKARIHLQEKEMQFAASRHMAVDHISLGGIFEAEDVCTMVRRNFAGRVALLRGDAEIVPGIRTHLVGGHTPGMQMVSVNTARGPVVIMSDAAHLYENIGEQRPFHIAFDVADMIAGWRRALTLAGCSDRVVPGHDPLVLDLYPPAAGNAPLPLAALHLPPKRNPLPPFHELMSRMPPLS